MEEEYIEEIDYVLVVLVIAGSERLEYLHKDRSVVESVAMILDELPSCITVFIDNNLVEPHLTLSNCDFGRGGRMTVNILPKPKVNRTFSRRLKYNRNIPIPRTNARNGHEPIILITESNFIVEIIWGVETFYIHVTQYNEIATGNIRFEYANPENGSSIYSSLNENELINDPGLITYLRTLEYGVLTKEFWSENYDLFLREW